MTWADVCSASSNYSITAYHVPTRASLVTQSVKNPPATWEALVWSLGWEDHLEEDMAACSSILAWRIPMDKEGLHSGLQSMGLQRVRHDWVTKHMFLPRYSSSFCSWKAESLYMLISPVSGQSLSNVQFFVTLWTAAHQTSLSFTISWSLLKLIESMMPSNHLILYHLLLLLPSVSQHQDLFRWISFSHQMAKVLEFQLQHQSFQWIFRIVLLSDWLVDLLAVQGTLKSLALFIYWSLL